MVPVSLFKIGALRELRAPFYNILFSRESPGIRSPYRC